MATFDRNVFVNCPFDKNYVGLLRPLLFTILYLGLKPRIATERSDSGELRLRKIVQLVRQSRFGIHDLSRCRSSGVGEFFRLNMPFELGIDHGCKEFKGGKWKKKKFLVLEAKRYSYQKALSDLAGVDIKSHGNKPTALIEVVRNWLVLEASAPRRPPSEIRARFNDFMSAHYEECLKRGYQPKEAENVPMEELKRAMEIWIQRNRFS